MRLVLDTSVIVAATRSDLGASRRLLVDGLDGVFELVLSVPLVLEYEAVLSRMEQLKASGMSTVDVGILVDALVSVASPVEFAFLWRPLSRDVNDDMVLETAFNGTADAIVTFNTRDLAEPARRFGIGVWTPGEALQNLEKSR